MKKKTILAAVIVFVLVLAGVYFGYPYYQVYRMNRHIDVNGIKLFTPIKKVFEIMGGEGEYIYGFGGFAHEYESENVRFYFSSDPDGKAYNKVSSIETGNPGHAVLGIHPGDSLARAVTVLEQAGFRKEESFYCKGDFYIRLTADYTTETVKEIQIGYIDRLLSDRVY